MLTYVDVIKIKYPDYVLTHIGNSSVYENIGWSIYNPTGPISKAQLDADMADLIAQGITHASLDITQDQTNELNAISNLPLTGSGFLKKQGKAQYSLDGNSYLTGITSSHVVDALSYTPYNAANPNNYTTKNYVDNLAVNGVHWLKPVHGFNFVGTASAPPLSANNNENYIIAAGGNTGVWSSFNVGDRVTYQNGWILREVTNIGCRLGVCFDKTTTGVGDALGKDNYIGEIIGGDAINGWTWEWTAPQANNAVFNNYTGSVKFGESYNYLIETDTWIAFAANVVGDGTALSYSGNTLNVNVGSGLNVVSDKLNVHIYPNGGIISTVDGVTPDSSDSASLALETIGTPGTFQSVTVDVYGRITSGSNPTTLAGYGITDAINSNLLGQPTGVATLGIDGKLAAAQVPTVSVLWSNISDAPNSLAGYGITDAAPLSHVSSTSLHLTTDQNTFLDSLTVSSTEVNYLSGTTLNVQSQINAKQDTITGAATTITSSNLTASRALTSDASGKVSVSTVTDTELSYLSGTTSSVQTQLDGKASNSALSTHAGDTSLHLTSAQNTFLDALTVSSTEVNQLSGVSSNIQTQLNGKQASLGFTPEDSAHRGVADGYCPLDSSAKVASTYLPSYVDDVLEYSNFAAFPATGESGKIYIATDVNKVYRWSGTIYVEITASPGSTDAVPEGTINLYFTNARAQAAITGGASSIVTSNLTTNRALTSDASGKVAVSAVTNTELGYVSGVTSAIQTQLGGKQPLESKLTSLSGLNNTTTGFLKYTNGVASFDTNNYIPATANSGLLIQSKTTLVPIQSGTTIIPTGVLPTTANGTQVASQSLTLLAATSGVAISWSTYTDCANNNKNMTIAIFRGTTCVYAQLINVTTANRAAVVSIYYVDYPNTAGAVTYSVRVGSDTATTWYIGQTSGGLTFPGANTSTITFWELA